jgi:hypothetical protein
MRLLSIVFIVSVKINRPIVQTSNILEALRNVCESNEAPPMDTPARHSILGKIQQKSMTGLNMSALALLIAFLVVLVVVTNMILKAVPRRAILALPRMSSGETSVDESGDEEEGMHQRTNPWQNM